MATDEARKFLGGLESHLNRSIPGPHVVRQHREQKEGAILDHYIAPQIYSHLTGYLAMGPEEARRAFLSESQSVRDSGISSGSPKRSRKHPFTKEMGASPQRVIQDWRGPSGLVQACPDMALRSPYKIVIEGKYFRKGGKQAAETALVTGIYECFFYRGLVNLPETKRYAAWDYDYACLLAYDATETASLFEAWRGIDESVKQGFWEGGGIYVMVLRGTG